MHIYHDGSNSYITQGGTGHLKIRQTTNDSDIIFECDDGSGGLATYFQLDGSQASSNYYYTRFPDKSSIVFGDSNDLRMYHDSTDSSIENETGHLYIQQKADDKDIIFRCDDGSGSVTEYLKLDGGDLSVNILTQKLVIANLPTSNPGVDGQVWNNSGVLNISSG